MKVQETHLSGVFVIEPKRHGDERGFFSESWSKRHMSAAGLHYDFVQDNHSLSRQAGTLRGLHYQAPPHAQAKLVRCGRGRLFDAVVDIRVGSPTYGESFGIELSDQNGLQLLVPEGFLHGFITRDPDTEVVYKVNDYYSAECDGSVRWDSCGIDWGYDGIPTLSAKDQTAPTLAEFESPFVWEMA